MPVPRQSAYRSRVAAPDDKAKRHGFLVVSRATRWRVRFATETPSEWSDKRDAEESLGKWRSAADDLLAQANEKIRQAREEFIAATEIEIATVANPNPFQADYQKTIITFPDGSTIQFSEGALQSEIDKAMEDASKEAHPDPDPKDIIGAPAELESVGVWEREFLGNGSRLPYPDIFTWSHYFPMSDVAQTLDELAQAGWSVVHASEDRGLHRSDLAESLSAPLAVRYLLVREIGPV